jgi:(E)-4-hydroxy-3-methyl-but-2-enyl pyrophosphate reductase
MQIEIGKFAGFCRGVKHAVEGAFSCAREADGDIFTDGQLIHNRQTLEMLERHGVRMLPEDGSVEAAAGKTIIVRAHGTTPQRIQQLREIARDVRNFTCRDVAKLQGIIKKHSRQGYSIIIFGKRAHPEVIGLLGFAQEGYVVFDLNDLERLPPLAKVCVVSQTTMSRAKYDEMCASIRQRFPEVVTVDTICPATEQRQEEVREMARRNDCILVIGGDNSSNTQRLFEIAHETTRTHFVSDVADIGKIDFTGVKRLGVTAGASTPDWLIEEVVEAVRSVSQSPFWRFLHTIVLFGIYSNLFVAFGSYLLSYAVADNVGLRFSPQIGILVALYYLSMSVLNSYTNRASMRIENQRRYRFVYAARLEFGVLFLLSLAGAIWIGWGLSREILILTVLSVVLGIGYNFSYLPMRKRPQRGALGMRGILQSLKSVVISMAVTLLLNGLPLLNAYPDLWKNPARAHEILRGLGFYFSICYVAMIMFVQQTLLEIKTAQSDRVAGVSSLLTLVKKEYLQLGLIALPSLLLLSMLSGLLLGAYPLHKAKYFLAICYTYIPILLSMHSKTRGRSLQFELLLETNIYVAGLIALI